MAITITNDNIIFKNNISIIFKNNKGVDNFVYQEQDYTFIFSSKNELLSINIFNYQRYLKNIEKGYHCLSDENFSMLKNKFPKYLNQQRNDLFFRVCFISKIEDHPKFNKMKLLFLNTETENFLVQTNLQNLKQNQKVLIAIEGAILATGIEIFNSKIGDISSQGMLISNNSLGIEKEGLFFVDKKPIIF